MRCKKNTSNHKGDIIKMISIVLALPLFGCTPRVIVSQQLKSLKNHTQETAMLDKTFEDYEKNCRVILKGVNFFESVLLSDKAPESIKKKTLKILNQYTGEKRISNQVPTTTLHTLRRVAVKENSHHL